MVASTLPGMITIHEAVEESEVGPGGDWLLDELNLLGVIKQHGDLHFDTQQGLDDWIAHAHAGNAILENRAKINDGAQPLLIVDGDMTCEEPLFVELFSLVVTGSLRAPGIFLGPICYISITGNLDAKAIVVWGSDGANIWCAGEARVGCFAHDQDGHQIQFVEAPVEFGISEKLRAENKGLEALIVAIEHGSDPRRVLEP